MNLWVLGTNYDGSGLVGYTFSQVQLTHTFFYGLTTLTYTPTSPGHPFVPTLPQLNWQWKPLFFRGVSAHADCKLFSHFLPAPLPCVTHMFWSAGSSPRDQRHRGEKERQRAAPFLPPPSVYPSEPLLSLSLSLILH